MEAGALTFWGVVLAAGRGERMGGPKALLVVPGGPLVAQHVAALARAGAQRVVVVTRPECAARLAALELGLERTTIVSAETPDPAASLAAALAHVPADVAVAITPVDAIPPRDDTMRALLAAVAGGTRAATPSHRGRGGHPVVCRGDVLAAYRVGSAPPLRDTLRALGTARARVEVHDEAVVVSLDRPDDVRARFGAAPQFI